MEAMRHMTRKAWASELGRYVLLLHTSSSFPSLLVFHCVVPLYPSGHIHGFFWFENVIVVDEIDWNNGIMPATAYGWSLQLELASSSTPPPQSQPCLPPPF